MKQTGDALQKAIVYDSVIVLQSPGGSQLGYKFHKSKISSWYKDSYEVKVVIEGRRIKQDYPQLYNAVLTDKMDSLNWLPEALTVFNVQRTKGYRSRFTVAGTIAMERQAGKSFTKFFRKIFIFKRPGTDTKRSCGLFREIACPFSCRPLFAGRIGHKHGKA